MRWNFIFFKQLWVLFKQLWKRSTKADLCVTRLTRIEFHVSSFWLVTIWWKSNECGKNYVQSRYFHIIHNPKSEPRFAARLPPTLHHRLLPTLTKPKNFWLATPARYVMLPFLECKKFIHWKGANVTCLLCKQSRDRFR